MAGKLVLQKTGKLALAACGGRDYFANYKCNFSTNGKPADRQLKYAN